MGNNSVICDGCGSLIPIWRTVWTDGLFNYCAKCKMTKPGLFKADQDAPGPMNRSGRNGNKEEDGEENPQESERPGYKELDERLDRFIKDNDPGKEKVNMAWSKERLEKFQTTMARKREEKDDGKPALAAQDKTSVPNIPNPPPPPPKTAIGTGEVLEAIAILRALDSETRQRAIRLIGPGI